MQFCVMCHNANWDDKARRPADQLPPESIHMKTMIHKIHTGEELETDFTIYGFGNTPITSMKSFTLETDGTARSATSQVRNNSLCRKQCCLRLRHGITSIPRSLQLGHASLAILLKRQLLTRY